MLSPQAICGGSSKPVAAAPSVSAAGRRGNFSTLTSEAFHPDPPKKTDLLQKSRGAPGQPLRSTPERWPAHRRARVVQWPPASAGVAARRFMSNPRSRARFQSSRSPTAPKNCRKYPEP